MRRTQHLFGSSGLRILCLFDEPTAEEYDAMLAYTDRLAGKWAGPWALLDVVRLVTRGTRSTDAQVEALVDRALATDKGNAARAQMLDLLAQRSEQALQELLSDPIPRSIHSLSPIVAAAGQSNAAMEALLRAVSYELGAMPRVWISEKIGLVRDVEPGPFDVLATAAQGEERDLDCAVLVASCCRIARPDGMSLLWQKLGSDVAAVRLVSAAALMQDARSSLSATQQLASILQSMVIGSAPTPCSASVEEVYERQWIVSKERQLAAWLLVNLVEPYPRLMGQPFLCLRHWWKPEIQRALAAVLDLETASTRVVRATDHLLNGDLPSFVKTTRPTAVTPRAAASLDRSVDRLKSNQLFFEVHSPTTPSEHLIRAVAGAVLDAWPLVYGMRHKVERLERPHPLVYVAMLAMTPSIDRSTSFNPPLSIGRDKSDTALLVLADMHRARTILDLDDEQSAVPFLHELMLFPDGIMQVSVMKAVPYFADLSLPLVEILKQGIESRDRYVQRAAVAALFAHPPTTPEDVELRSQILSRESYKDMVNHSMVEEAREARLAAIPAAFECFKAELGPDPSDDLGWKVEYWLRTLMRSSATYPPLAELIESRLTTLSWGREDLRRGLRPLMVLAMGRARPVNPDVLNTLTSYLRPGRSRSILQILRDPDFDKVAMAAALALSEAVGDSSSGLSGSTAESIGRLLLENVRKRVVTGSSVIAHDGFPRDANDGFYQAASEVATFIRARRDADALGLGLRKILQQSP